MDFPVIQEFAKYGSTVLIMAIMIWYFMKTVDKKEKNNQDNLMLFINMQKESNTIHIKTGEILNTMLLKLNEVHTDVKSSKK